MGHNEINRLRGKAEAALGEGYDYKAFNDAVVKTGGVPMTVLEQEVDAHIAERRARSRRVVEDDAEGVAAARADSTHAMAPLQTLTAEAALPGELGAGEAHRVPLRPRHNLAPRRPARAPP